MKSQDNKLQLNEETNSFWDYFSNLPKPNLQNVINIYSAYSYGGTKAATIMASTSLADGALKNYGVERNYFSLSAFWGGLAYNALSNMGDSKNMDSTTKLVLATFAGIASLAMIYKGKDIFAETHNFQKTVNFSVLAAEILDDSDTIKSIKNSFSESTYSGLKFTLENSSSIFSNKFIITTLLKQGVDITALLLTQKFLNQAIHMDNISIFNSYQNGESFDFVMKASLFILLRMISTQLHQKANNYISSIVEKASSEKIVTMLFDENNSQKIIKIGKPINNFASNLSHLINNSSADISNLLKDIINPLLISNGSSTQSSNIFDDYPSLILSDALFKQILNSTNFQKISDWLQDYLNIKTEPEVNKYVEINCQKLGNCTINSRSTPEIYAYQNIQEIVKSSGGGFMLPIVIGYINSDNTQNGNYQYNNVIDTTRDILQSMVFAGLLPSLNIKNINQLMEVQHSIKNLSDTFFKDEQCQNNGQINEEDIYKEVVDIYEILQNGPKDYGAKRLQSKTLELTLKNYHLKKKISEDSDQFCKMLHIDNLQLTKGKIYAISGKIGTGKTTLLSDIAKCLPGAFESSGEIYYPTKNSEEIPKIFCGTQPFAPPATSLFERITYRIPKEYVKEHKASLERQCLDIFSELDQSGFTKAKLNEVGNDNKIGLSTGQGKLVILIGAMLYKDSLYKDSPCLFVIDETLANLDKSTSDKVCSKIKEQFSDSIVISVDHSWKSSPDFYDCNIDLSGYVDETQDELI